MNTSADKTFYDQTEEINLEQHKRWMEEIKYYFNAYSSQLNDALSDTTGKVIELGAGSCGLSLNLTNLSNIQKVYSVDISSKRMEHMLQTSNQYVKGELSKIELKESDFNLQLPFEDQEIDAILFDASLHHSRSLWNLLAECHRILRPNGLLIAQRESFLNAFRAKSQLAHLLKSPEFSAKVSENMYLKEQYEYYLKIHDFSTVFLPISPSPVKSILRPFNGILFCDGVLYCTKQ